MDLLSSVVHDDQLDAMVKRIESNRIGKTRTACKGRWKKRKQTERCLEKAWEVAPVWQPRESALSLLKELKDVQRVFFIGIPSSDLHRRVTRGSDESSII